MPRAEPVPIAKQGYAEGHLCRGATPRAALGIDYADGHCAYAEGYRPSASSAIPVVICRSLCSLHLRLDLPAMPAVDFSHDG
jgi:hypothetical protein